MTYEEMRKLLEEALARRMRLNDDQLFSTMTAAAAHAQQQELYRRFTQQQGPPRYGFSGFRDGQGRMEFPDDGKTITLTKDDYNVEEEPCPQTTSEPK